MKLISMSLYGSGGEYSVGAVENAQLARTIYPSWVLRVYCEKRHTAIVPLLNLGAEVVQMDSPSGVFGMSWRFLAVSDPTASHIIIRDCDSRLNVREKSAVDAWIASGKTGHLMRDHPHHCHYSEIWKIFGGMWGIKGGVITDMEHKITEFKAWNNRADDMLFLTQYIWPIIENDHIAHGIKGEPFPAHPPYDGFVGQRFNEKNVGLPE